MATPAIWRTPSAEVQLLQDEVHVWRASLDVDPASLGRLSRTLAPDEKARAARFKFAQDRDRFTAARGILRQLLSRYSNIAPAEVQFRYGIQGKPALQATEAERPISFSVSHSHDLAVYAFSLGREVGVDVERIRPEFAGEDIAERFFSRREVAELLALAPGTRTQGFFNCWTRKEAYVKAKGDGLSVPLSKFDVSLAPGKPAELTSVDADRWGMQSFSPAENYAAAVVAEGKCWRLCYWHWTSELEVMS